MKGAESSHRITTVVLQMLTELFNRGISDWIEVKCAVCRHIISSFHKISKSNTSIMTEFKKSSAHEAVLHF